MTLDRIALGLLVGGSAAILVWWLLEIALAYSVARVVGGDDATAPAPVQCAGNDRPRSTCDLAQDVMVAHYVQCGRDQCAACSHVEDAITRRAWMPDGAETVEAAFERLSIAACGSTGGAR